MKTYFRCVLVAIRSLSEVFFLFFHIEDIYKQCTYIVRTKEKKDFDLRELGGRSHL